MSEHLVRVERLKELQEANGWSDAELARQCRRTPQQVRSWWSGDRLIGEKLARSLEEVLGLRRFALDERPGIAHSVAEQAKPPSSHGAVRVTKGFRNLPILGWDQVEEMLEADNSTLKARAPHLSSFAVASEKAKFLEMIDDSMAPTFQPGDHVLFDPIEVPHAGDVVLVKLPNGEHFVRTFRPRTAFVFEATAANESYQALSSVADGARVVAVMVEHRRYRRR